MKGLFRTLKTIFVFSLILGLIQAQISSAYSASVPPSPGDSVLIIYINNTYGSGAANFIKTSLDSAPLTAAQQPTVTLLGITPGTSGIASALASAGLSLSTFCQVWDIRFEPNPSSQTCNTTQDDVITAADSSAYQAFLGQGGHLTILGDNSGYCPRDNSLLNFTLAATGASIGFPTTAATPKTWTTINNGTSDLLATNVNNLNTLGGIDTYYPGELSLAGGIGNGTAMITDGTNAVALMWNSPPAIGSGKLYEMFDTNVFADAPTAADGVRAANSAAYAQNLYTAMSTCFNFTMSKTVNPTSVCIGSNANFTICLTNTGSRTITNPQIIDTIPSCLTYVSSNPASSAGPGTMRIFNTVASLANGNSVCVTITVQANSLNCP